MFCDDGRSGKNVGVSSNNPTDKETAVIRRLNPMSDVKATSRDPDANAETATNRANNHAHVDDRVTGTVPNGTPTVSKTHRHASPPSSLGEAGGVAEVEVDMADEGVAKAVVVAEATAAHSRATVTAGLSVKPITHEKSPFNGHWR